MLPHSAGSSRQDQAGSPDFSADPQIVSRIRRQAYIPGLDHPDVREFHECMGSSGYDLAVSSLMANRYVNAARCAKLKGAQTAVFEAVYGHGVDTPRRAGKRKQVALEITNEYVNSFARSSPCDCNPTSIRRAINVLVDRRILVQVGDSYTVNLDYALWKTPSGAPLPRECVEWLDGPESLDRFPHGCNPAGEGTWDDDSPEDPWPDSDGPRWSDPGPGDFAAPTHQPAAPTHQPDGANATAQGSLLDARAPASDSGSVFSARPESLASSKAQGEYIYIPPRVDAGARADAPGRDAQAHAREAGLPCCPPPAPADAADGGAPAVAPGVDYDPAIISAFRAFLESKMTLRYVAYNCFYMETSYHSWWLMKAAKRAWLRKKYSAAYIQTILANWAKAGEPDPGPEDDFDDEGRPIPPGSRIAAPQPGAQFGSEEEWSSAMYDRMMELNGDSIRRLRAIGL